MVFKCSEADALWYLHLTEPQQRAYDSFHAKLSEESALVEGVCSRTDLLRFLKARQWDVEKAALMYHHMAAWRKEHQVQTVFETLDFKELPACLPVYPHFYQLSTQQHAGSTLHACSMNADISCDMHACLL